jgi:hypothetical protein
MLYGKLTYIVINVDRVSESFLILSNLSETD